MIALVFGVTFSSIRSGSMLKVSGSISAKTGTAPSRAIEPAVAKKVNDGQTTSSPGPTPYAISVQSSASVPLLTPMACFVPQYAARSRSNRSTCGPRISACASHTSSIARRISWRRGRYCASRSSSLTFMGVGEERTPSPLYPGERAWVRGRVRRRCVRNGPSP